MLLLSVASCTRWSHTTQPLPELLPDAEKRPSRLKLLVARRGWVTVERPLLRNDSIVWMDRKAGETGVPVADVNGVQRQQVDGVRTGVAIVAGALVVFAIAGAIALANADWGWGGGGDGTTYSCPLVYSWDGTRWRLDSGTFGGAITQGLQRSDIDNLDHLRPDHGLLRLRVANELEETDHIDRIRLLAVDHAPGTSVAPDPEGGLHTLGSLLAPMSARDLEGRDVLNRVNHRDNTGWESSLRLRDTSRVETARDRLELRFHRPAGAPEAHLVLDGNSTMWAAWLLGEWLAARGTALEQWYHAVDSRPELAQRVRDRVASEAFLQVSILTRDGWKAQATYGEAGPEVSKRQVIHLDLRAVEGREVVVRLESAPSFWWIDAVALEAARDQELTVTPLTHSLALSHDDTDPSALINEIDGRYLTIERDQWIELAFTSLPKLRNRERSYLLDSNGWYRIHPAARPVADAELLRRIDTEPGAISRVSTGRLNDAVRALSGSQ